MQTTGKSVQALPWRRLDTPEPHPHGRSTTAVQKNNTPAEAILKLFFSSTPKKGLYSLSDLTFIIWHTQDTSARLLKNIDQLGICMWMFVRWCVYFRVSDLGFIAYMCMTPKLRATLAWQTFFFSFLKHEGVHQQVSTNMSCLNRIRNVSYRHYSSQHIQSFTICPHLLYLAPRYICASHFIEHKVW